MPGLAYQAPPSLVPTPYIGGIGATPVGHAPVNEKIIDDHLAVQAIIRSYQV